MTKTTINYKKLENAYKNLKQKDHFNGLLDLVEIGENELHLTDSFLEKYPYKLNKAVNKYTNDLSIAAHNH